MKDLNECKAEIFRRSKEKINKKKQKRRILVSLSLCLCLCIASAGLLRGIEKEKTAIPQYSNGSIGGVGYNISAEIEYMGRTFSYAADKEDTRVLAAMVESLFSEKDGSDMAEPPNSGNTEDLEGTKDPVKNSPVNGTEQVYHGSGSPVFKLKLRYADASEKLYLFYPDRVCLNDIEIPISTAELESVLSAAGIKEVLP